MREINRTFVLQSWGKLTPAAVLLQAPHSALHHLVINHNSSRTVKVKHMKVIGGLGQGRHSLLHSCSRTSSQGAATLWSSSAARTTKLHNVLSRAHISGQFKVHSPALQPFPLAAVPRANAASAQLQSAALSTSANDRPAKEQQQQHGKRPQAQQHGKQTLDYTALEACCHELSGLWVPSKVEEVCPG